MGGRIIGKEVRRGGEFVSFLLPSHFFFFILHPIAKQVPSVIVVVQRLRFGLSVFGAGSAYSGYVLLGSGVFFVLISLSLPSEFGCGLPFVGLLSLVEPFECRSY
ncbi:hypothetical protein FN846DRAFT_978985 [Sphaerosporella brunnea]|uniref:Transmembrane protein n=1 Tax=Sphaerosporella brunnea TaxID=1250544 RepID=A0A5J5EDY3_9PEZI|nr:hypothetical protein FN846DRAFT_978985 [Sphaerosporella brunnea]